MSGAVYFLCLLPGQGNQHVSYPMATPTMPDNFAGLWLKFGTCMQSAVGVYSVTTNTSWIHVV